MKHWGRRLRRQAVVLSLTLLVFYRPLLLPAAETPAPVAQPDVQMTLTKQPTDSQPLGLDDALLMALDNHPSLKAARERVAAQQAVLGQQMAAYYPTITMSNFYRTTTESGNTTGVSNTAFDTFFSQTAMNLILYNFGKREGNVQ